MVIKFKILKMQSLLQVGIFLMCFKNILMQSSIIPYSNLLDGLLAGVSMICIAISILSEKQSLKEIIFFVMLIFASLICAIKTNNNIFIIMSMICWVIKNDNFDAIILNIFKIQLFLFVIHTILSLTFLILGKQEIVMTISGIERYCFGFRHPNSFSIYMFNLLLLWTWINYKKLRFKHLCVIGAISVISWRFTKTRTSLLIALVFCLLLFVAKSKYKLKNVLNSIAKFALPICAMFTFLCVKLYIVGNKIGLFINDLLSNRIKLGAYTIEHFGFSFWGQDISRYNVVWDSEWRMNAFTFDNLYTFLAVNLGTVWIIILSLAFYKLAQKKSLKINVFIIIWSMYAITEVQVVNGFRFFPMLMLGLLFEKEISVCKDGNKNI